MSATDYSLPSSPEAERSILGAILLDNSLANEALIALKADHFFLDAHRRIYQRLAGMLEQGIPLDIVSLTVDLMAHKELEAVGGAGYIASLTDGVPRRSSVQHYVSIVIEKANLRNLIHAANGVISQALEQSISSLAIIEQHNQSLANISAETGGARDIAVPAREFLDKIKPTREWLVEGLIEKGSNGFVVAEPKASKSFFTVALADSLARGDTFLSFNVPRRVRTLVLNAEDNPETTRWRLSGLERHMGYTEELDGWLWVTTKEQFPSFKLDRPSDIRDIVATCKKHQIEFLILDVLNVLHDADENYNKEMRRVLSSVNTIQAKAGCQICIVHHYNKSDGQSITKRMRGSSAISGFAEWIVGLDVVDEVAKVRRAQFEIKGGEAPLPVHYQIMNMAAGGIHFQVVAEQGEPAPEPKRRWE